MFIDCLIGVRRCARLPGLLLLLALCGCAEPAPRTDAPGLRVGDLLGAGSDGQRFARADAPRLFEFPADHGAHPGFRSEWWYLTLALEDDHGREFGVQFTIFRQALFAGAAADDPWRNGQGYLGHFAVTDVQAGTHREAERLARGHPALAGAGWGGQRPGLRRSSDADVVPLDAAASTDSSPVHGRVSIRAGGGFSVWLEGWSLVSNGEDWLLNAATPDLAVSARLTPTKPVVLQGDGGLSVKGPGQASYYYSVPRLQVAGTLRTGAESRPVTGIGWLDREWSTSVLADRQIGWDWFALMLDGGEDIMVFRLRRDDGSRDPHDHGVLVDGAGDARHLDSASFDLEPLEYWRDERGTDWPVRWRLRVAERQWQIAAPVTDQRMDTLLTYWEGLVHVLDRRNNKVGRGYMELTGYR